VHAAGNDGDGVRAMSDALKRLAERDPARWAAAYAEHHRQWVAAGKVVETALPVGSQLRINAALNARVRACEHRECRGCGSAWCVKHAGLKTYADCHVCPDLPLPPMVPVSIVIAARNQAAYLREAIESAKLQTSRAVEVIYSDDASTDDSVAIARNLGVTVLTSSTHEGVCAARNRADAVAKGEWIVHLDGDDVLPVNYLAEHAAALAADPDAALVYSGADLFGVRTARWDARPWNPAELHQGNTIHTAAMVRAKALRAVGGWREKIGTAWDWDLWLRLAAAGYRGVPTTSTKLRYRQHAANITDAQQLRDAEHGRRLHLMMRLAHSRPAVCCVLSDRLPSLWSVWFNRATECVRQFRRWAAALDPFAPFGERLDVPVDLVVLYTGNRDHLATVHRLVRHYWTEDANVSIIAQRWTADGEGQDRLDGVSRFLASAYNRFLDLPNDLLWFLEDDVLPPRDALVRLAEAALGGERIEPAVAGWYRSRHGDPHIIANRRDSGGVMRPVTDIEPGPNPVDLTGTGCLLIHKRLAGHRFTSHWRDAAAHDFAWCDQLAQPVVIVGEVECRHYRTAGEWV
jgi:GT2 family glycosyltransferase